MSKKQIEQYVCKTLKEQLENLKGLKPLLPGPLLLTKE